MLPKHFRSFSDILAELKRLQQEYKDQGFYERSVICEAIAWGYASSRTIRLLEKHLDTADDYRSMVEGVAGIWDGQGYLGGALAAAQQWGRRLGLWKVDMEKVTAGEGLTSYEAVLSFVEKGETFKLIQECIGLAGPVYVLETIQERNYWIVVTKEAARCVGSLAGGRE